MLDSEQAASWGIVKKNKYRSAISLAQAQAETDTYDEYLSQISNGITPEQALKNALPKYKEVHTQYSPTEYDEQNNIWKTASGLNSLNTAIGNLGNSAE